MPRDPSEVNDELVALVGEASRAPEAEVRAALAPLSAADEKVLRRALRTVSDDELSPFAWADLARGVELRVAQARELSGYYALQAERDALAAMVSGPREAARAAVSAVERPAPAKARAAEREPVQSLVAPPKAKPAAVPRETKKPAGTRTRGEQPPSAKIRGERPGPARIRGEQPAATKIRAAAPDQKRAQDLLGLFSYHRDAPLVARALKLSLNELIEELDALKIRRAAFRLTRGLDSDLPQATVLPGGNTAAVRRRTKKDEAAKVAPAPRSERESQQAQLKLLLAELGPRRSELAARLGGDGAPLSEAALLARFRGADLEREFSLRERDLIRALYKKHRGSEAKVAADLRAGLSDVRRIVAARGLARELEGLKSGFLRDARRKKWPKERIAQVLDEADDLRELGLYDELLREVAARTGVLWKSLAGKKDALDLLAQKLRLERRDALRLQRLLDLR